MVFCQFITFQRIQCPSIYRLEYFVRNNIFETIVYIHTVKTSYYEKMIIMYNDLSYLKRKFEIHHRYNKITHHLSYSTVYNTSFMKYCNRGMRQSEPKSFK